jgi:hypothetical protein
MLNAEGLSRIQLTAKMKNQREEESDFCLNIDDFGHNCLTKKR